jgi:hypothetical protein
VSVCVLLWQRDASVTNVLLFFSSHHINIRPRAFVLATIENLRFERSFFSFGSAPAATTHTMTFVFEITHQK